jgi:MFS family permease
VGRAIVRDLYAGAAGARYLSRLMIVIGLAPILAPIVGGQLLRVTSWRGVFVALSVLGLALTAVGARLLPETLPRERRRAGGLRVTLETFARLLGDRRFVGFVLIVGLGGGAMIGYVAGSSFVLQDVYGASPQLYGLLFGLNAVFLVARIDVVRRTDDPDLYCSFAILGPDRRRWEPNTVYISRDLDDSCPRDKRAPLGRTQPLEVIFQVPERYVGELAGVAIDDPISRDVRPVLTPP